MFWRRSTPVDRTDEVLGALEGLTSALAAPVTDDAHGPDLEQRVAALERDMARHMAEAEALIVKGNAKFQAARAAEQREKRYAEAAQGTLELDEEGDLTEEQFLALQGASPGHGNGGGGEGGGVLEMRTDLGGRSAEKQRLTAAKWGAVGS